MQNIGVIFGNRDFFPDHLVSEARNDVVALFAQLEIHPVMVSESDTKLGGIETYADAQKCADLFKAKGKAIEGILVVLPNFGDEKGIADTIRMSGLNCPVLVQAYPDELARLEPAARRDAFCGKVSVCNNLRQYGIPFSTYAWARSEPDRGRSTPCVTARRYLSDTGFRFRLSISPRSSPL
jgi:L-fucose isomerase-like protein